MQCICLKCINTPSYKFYEQLTFTANHPACTRSQVKPLLTMFQPQSRLTVVQSNSLILQMRQLQARGEVSLPRLTKLIVASSELICLWLYKEQSQCYFISTLLMKFMLLRQ